MGTQRSAHTINSKKIQQEKEGKKEKIFEYI